MKKDEKKYRRSGVSVACYVIAALMLGYVCYQIGTTVHTINEYYESYGMSAQPLEYITYSLQSALQPIMYMIVVFMLGYILDAVRRNNKAYYLTEEEVLEAQEAKKQAREAKKFAKGEAAALKAGNVTTTEESVEADFAKSLDAELKADEKKAESKAENRKPRSYSYNRSGQNKQGGNKTNSSKSGNSDSKNSKSGSKQNNNSGGSKSSNGGQRKSSKKPADKPKLEDATKSKADDGFEVTINDKEK